MAVREETSEDQLRAALHEALARGIVTGEQVRQIVAVQAEASGSATARDAGWLRPKVAEALGYVGGALALLATVLLVQQFWSDVPPSVRVALLTATSVGLLIAGTLVRVREGPLDRLRGFLWLLSAAAVGGTVAVGLFEYTDLREARMMLATGLVVSAYGLAVWLVRQGSLQQLVVFAAMLVVVTSAIGVVDPSWVDATGLAVWVVGVAWASVAWSGWIRPRRTGLLIGAAAALLGPITVPDDRYGWMLIVGLATAGLLIAISIPAREAALLGLGVVGIFAYVPRIVFQYFGDTLGAPVSLLFTGTVLVAIALILARRRPSRRVDDAGEEKASRGRAA